MLMGVHRDKVLQQQQLEKWLVGSEGIFIRLSHINTNNTIDMNNAYKKYN